MSTAVNDHSIDQSPGQLDDAGRSLLFLDARTAKSFDPTPISDDELRGIWDLAKWAPTGSNVQPLRVLFVRTSEGKERLGVHMSDSNRPRTVKAPAVAVLATDTRFHETLNKVVPSKPDMRKRFDDDEALLRRTADFNGYIQCGYFILAVRAAGFAAGPMKGFNATKLDADFFPDGRWKSLLVVNIGHPGTNPWEAREPRHEHDDVLAWA